MNRIPETIIILITSIALHCFADNICNETVAVNRGVDGIPAYEQCSTSTSGSIFSNNGIDTRATSGGTGWIRTQWGGGYQCTEFAYRYLRFRWNIKSVPSGNAGSWGDDVLPAGLIKTTTPIHGDLIIFAPGSCGAATTTGHVAVIDAVDSVNLTIVEQNSASRRKCKVSCAKCFIHAQTNNGSVPVMAGQPNSILFSSAIWVGTTKDKIAIRLGGYFADGASVRVYNLRGQLIADLTDQSMDGETSFATVAESSTSLVVSVSKGCRSICRKVVLKR